VDLRQYYESINRNKMFEIMRFFEITTKLLKLVSATMDKGKTCVKIQNNLTVEVNEGLKQGKWLEVNRGQEH
jgi:hypothetical protein